MSFPNDLEKLTIHNLDEGNVVTVLFNPNMYAIQSGNTWTEQKRVGQTPELQFTAQNLRQITLDLFVDTYEQKTDVRDITQSIAQLLLIDPSLKRPPLLQLVWGGVNTVGGLPAQSVLVSLQQQFILFNRQGVPVRAKLSTTFKEVTQLAPNALLVPDQRYLTQPGDTLSGIAARFRRDDRLWRDIARRNGIDNPRLVPTGRRFAIPPPP